MRYRSVDGYFRLATDSSRFSLAFRLVAWTGLLAVVCCSPGPDSEGASTPSPCVSDTQAPCCKSQDCQRQGRCEFDVLTEMCFAISSAHCQSSLNCMKLGECTLDAVRGECVVVTDSDCQRSSACTSDGRCSSSLGGCYSTVHIKQCKTSAECESVGRCSPSIVGQSLTCIVGSASDCERSKVCRVSGCCRPDLQAGPSVVCGKGTQSGCAAAETCKADGGCTPGKFGCCMPATSADCASSTACKERGECSVMNSSGHDNACRAETDRNLGALR